MRECRARPWANIWLQRAYRSPSSEGECRESREGAAEAEYGKSEQLVCIFVLCWRALSFNRSSPKSSTRARTSAFFDRPRRFELRKPPHARKMHGRFGMTMQCEPRPIFGLRFDRLEESCFIAFKEGDGNTAAVEHAIAGERRKLRTWREDAGEVQWIGAGNRDETVVSHTAPDRAQGGYRFGKGKLLAGEPGHEASAPDLATGLKVAIDAQQLAPSRQPRSFALEHAHEHDAVAAEQRTRYLLYVLRVIALGGLAVSERPSAGTS